MTQFIFNQPNLINIDLQNQSFIVILTLVFLVLIQANKFLKNLREFKGI